MNEITIKHDTNDTINIKQVVQEEKGLIVTVNL